MPTSKPPKRLSRSEIISEVARNTNLRRDVVEIVYEGLIDVAVSELVNKGTLRILDTFDVSTKEWGKSPVTGTAAPRLIVRVTRPVREFIREIRMGRFKSKVTPTNWRDHYYSITQQKKNDAPVQNSEAPRRLSASEIFGDDY